MELNYLLIGVVVFLIASALNGYKRGFLRIAITLVGLVAIMMIVIRVYPYVRDFVIEKTPAYEKVREKVVEAFPKDNSDESTDYENEEQIIESYNLPDLIAGALIENNQEEIYNELAVNIFEEYIAGYLSRMIINAGTFIALVAILWAVLYALLIAADILGRIPVLKTFNKLMGMGCGLVVGVIVVWLLFLVVITFLGDDISSLIMSYVNESPFLSYLFNSNPLFDFIK